MGTGIGAVEEGLRAGRLLKRLLCAGYPAEYALRSLNSLCALRSRAGAVTVDLAELQLDSGKVSLYKWGAAPSWVLRRTGPEKIGTATPPPGLSVSEGRETVERLSLRRGEVLVLLSDGVGGEDALHGCVLSAAVPLGELAAEILESGAPDTGDDATVAVVRLCPDALGA
jgi:stage II sporulation protein E